MTSATEAITRLQTGNRRFVDTAHEKRAPWTERQAPFAIVLACSDSRVPVEAVFDQELGDLFVVRVAGNIATPSQIGSIEFAALQFGVGLIVVLGHSNCGAVATTLEHLASKKEVESPNLQAIAEQISSAVAPVLARHGGDAQRAIGDAVTANIAAQVAQLRHSSVTIDRLIRNGELAVIGAEYSLHTGEVHFLDTPLD